MVAVGGLQWRNRFGWGRKWGGETGCRGGEGAVATIHFATGGEGCCAGEGEQAAAALCWEASSWPSAGMKIKTIEIRGTCLGRKGTWAEMENGLQDLVFRIDSRFWIQVKDIKLFQIQTFWLGSNKIQSNHNFGDFSNLEIWNLVSNNQI
jgi:hypothetical protein